MNTLFPLPKPIATPVKIRHKKPITGDKYGNICGEIVTLEHFIHMELELTNTDNMKKYTIPPRNGIQAAIDKCCGYDYFKEQGDLITKQIVRKVIRYMKHIITLKKRIEVDYELDEQALVKLQNIIKSKKP